MTVICSLSEAIETSEGHEAYEKVKRAALRLERDRRAAAQMSTMRTSQPFQRRVEWEIPYTISSYTISRSDNSDKELERPEPALHRQESRTVDLGVGDVDTARKVSAPRYGGEMERRPR
ncbi:hypothetical protein Y032_0057g2726 [Ancylostoma ceylanicum]|uniref:Uncharacterized protein n=1 Tax=Ancylostoma ceylanicum TaxID=53326 RepID=A0A016U637_9BILA|nr:hypothetical protein Y032_0057g2726 [Ancylostoma ceylanicum]